MKILTFKVRNRCFAKACNRFLKICYWISQQVSLDSSKDADFDKFPPPNDFDRAFERDPLLRTREAFKAHCLYWGDYRLIDVVESEDNPNYFGFGFSQDYSGEKEVKVDARLSVSEDTEQALLEVDLMDYGDDYVINLIRLIDKSLDNDVDNFEQCVKTEKEYFSEHFTDVSKVFCRFCEIFGVEPSFKDQKTVTDLIQWVCHDIKNPRLGIYFSEERLGISAELYNRVEALIDSTNFKQFELRWNRTLYNTTVGYVP